jgi:hypothetical protein
MTGEEPGVGPTHLVVYEDIFFGIASEKSIVQRLVLIVIIVFMQVLVDPVTSTG